MMEINAVYPELVSSYARTVYYFGTITLQEVPENYRIPCMAHAINVFPLRVVDTALAKNYITQQEYLDTLALKNN